MDEQPRARNVDDFLQAPVLGTEHTMAINRRQKNDRELAAFVRLDVNVRKQGIKQIRNPFHGQESTPFHAADILDGAVARAEDFWRAGIDGTILRFEATSEHRVQRPIGLERLFRFLFVQARGIPPGIHVPKEAQPKTLRGDGKARQLDGDEREEER